jgi:serine/threonine protein kinase
MPRILVGDFGEGNVEGSGTIGTGTIEVVIFEDGVDLVHGSGTCWRCATVKMELTLGLRSSRKLSTKADMFSLGMVIHFMAFKGRLPYHATGETLESLNELRAEVQSYPGYPSLPSFLTRYTHDDRDHLPDELHELLRLLLSRQPDKRPSSQEVLNMMSTSHPPARNVPPIPSN